MLSKSVEKCLAARLEAINSTLSDGTEIFLVRTLGELYGYFQFPGGTTPAEWICSSRNVLEIEQAFSKGKIGLMAARDIDAGEQVYFELIDDFTAFRQLDRIERRLLDNTRKIRKPRAI